MANGMSVARSSARTRPERSRSWNDSLMLWMSTTPTRASPARRRRRGRGCASAGSRTTISGSGVVRGISATSRRMMSETLRLARRRRLRRPLPDDAGRAQARDVHGLAAGAAAPSSTASTETTIIGSSTAVFCVSSKIMITASSGARVMPASKPSHAEQRVTADGSVERGRHGLEELRDDAADRRADHQRRREDAAHAPGADRRGRRDDLADEEQQEEDAAVGLP